MAKNSAHRKSVQEALNIQLGQAGSAVFTTHDAAVQYPGIVYIAITFL